MGVDIVLNWYPLETIFYPMIKLLFTLILLVSVLNLRGQFTNIPVTPTLFMEGEVSTNISERDMAISPDGNEMYFTLLGNQNAFFYHPI